MQPSVWEPASRTRRLAARDRAQVAAEGARGPGTAVVDPDQEPDHTAADPDQEPDHTAAGREPDQEPDHTAAGREPDQERGPMVADQERGPMVAGREPAPRRVAAVVDLRRANRAVVLAQHPGSTVVPAQDLDRAADRGRHRGNTAVRAG